MKQLTKKEEIAQAKARARQQAEEKADFIDKRILSEQKAHIRELEKQELARYEATTPLEKKHFGAKGLGLKNIDTENLPPRLDFKDVPTFNKPQANKNLESLECDAFNLYGKISLKLKQIYTDQQELQKLSIWNYGTQTPYDKLKDVLKLEFGKGFAGKAKNNYLGVVKLLSKKLFDGDLCKCANFLIKNRDLLPEFNSVR